MIFGLEGNDVIFDQEGDDNLDGGAGADQIIGGIGNDVIFGVVAGNDVLRGEGGDDFLEGGAGLDTFQYLFNGFDVDTVLDFQIGQEMLQVSTSILSNFAEHQAASVAFGSGTAIFGPNEGDIINLESHLRNRHRK